MNYFKKCPECGRYMTPHLRYVFGQAFLFILASADIQKIHAESGTITKQLIWEVERLTERLSDKYPCNGCKVDRQIGNPNRWERECSRCDKPNDWKNDCVKKLAEYEIAEDEGRLVVLPCDTVYFIWNKSSGISHVRAKSILDLSLREILGIDKDGRYWSVKEEAEKALKEMKKNE